MFQRDNQDPKDRQYNGQRDKRTHNGILYTTLKPPIDQHKPKKKTEG